MNKLKFLGALVLCCFLGCEKSNEKRSEMESKECYIDGFNIKIDNNREYIGISYEIIDSAASIANAKVDGLIGNNANAVAVGAISPSDGKRFRIKIYSGSAHWNQSLKNEIRCSDFEISSTKVKFIYTKWK